MMDQPHDILRKARIKKGYESAEAAAKAFGWNVVTYRSHENGIRGVSGIPKEAAKRYAAAFGIPIGQLIAVDSNSTSTAEVAVIGEAAFGVWRTNALDREHTKNRKSLSAPSLSSEGKMRFAIKIIDDSVNKLLLPGQFAIFITPSEPIKNNALVVVERTRGDLVERTVRRYIAAKPTPKLVSHSTSPMYQETLLLSDGQGGAETVRIIGLVVGTHSDYPDGLIVT